MDLRARHDHAASVSALAARVVRRMAQLSGNVVQFAHQGCWAQTRQFSLLDVRLRCPSAKAARLAASSAR
jgi:hypothetical protein